MTTRYFLLEDVGRVVKLEAGAAYVYRDGVWHESTAAWAKVQGFDGADGREITADEAERIIRAERFVWTEEDFESGGVEIE
jgi:hypothetical protein